MRVNQMRANQTQSIGRAGDARASGVNVSERSLQGALR